MPSSPQTANTDLTTFSILSNGVEIPATYQISSIKIKQQVNTFDKAEIVFLTSLTDSDALSTTFKPDSSIQINLGYHAANETVFKGSVTNYIIKASLSSSTFTVVCSNEQIKEFTTHINKNAIPELRVEYGVDIYQIDLELNTQQHVAALNKFNGLINFQGSAKARINTLIEIAGLGTKFNGNVLITSVVHFVRDGNWLTTVGIGTLNTL